VYLKALGHQRFATDSKIVKREVFVHQVKPYVKFGGRKVRPVKKTDNARMA